MPIRFELDTDFLQFSKDMSAPVLKPIEKIQVTDRSAGGKLHVENLGPDINSRPLVFDSMPIADYIALEDWFAITANGAMNSFTYIDEETVSHTVKILDKVLNFKDGGFGYVTGQLLLEIVD
jgi:hypothetical protein